MSVSIIVFQDQKKLHEMLHLYQGRLDHCFSLTPTTLRHQLQMDEEAGYSITDEVTADQMTMRILDAFQHVGCTTLYIISAAFTIFE